MNMNYNLNDIKVHRFKHDGDTDSLILYAEDILLNKHKEEIIANLNSMDDFERGANYYGQIRRHQKWYQTEGRYFSEGWRNQTHERWTSKKYNSPMLTTQQLIESICNNIITHYPSIPKVKYNSCLVNKYRSKQDSIRHHRDTPTSFGAYPTISNLSLGDERIIEFKRVLYDSSNPSSLAPDVDNAKDNFAITLKSGSLLIMAGSSQKYFSHGVPPNEGAMDKATIRYSLTFREYLNK